MKFKYFGNTTNTRNQLLHLKLELEEKQLVADARQKTLQQASEAKLQPNSEKVKQIMIATAICIAMSLHLSSVTEKTIFHDMSSSFIQTDLQNQTHQHVWF